MSISQNFLVNLSELVMCGVECNMANILRRAHIMQLINTVILMNLVPK